MTDYFSLLEQPRKPWLDPEIIKAKFLALSSTAHPDRWHAASEAERDQANQHFAELNAAYRTLSDPKERIAHLLLLETGSKPAQVHTVPNEIAEVFIGISQISRDVDAFLKQKAKETSPLLRARMFERGLEWTEKLQHLQQQLNARTADLLEQLQSLNASWDTAPPPGSPQRRSMLPLQKLEEIHRLLSYFNRWSAQIRERLTHLAL